MTENDGASDNASPARPVKRSFSIAGHKTSISLEAAFWEALRITAERERVSLASLVQRIDKTRGSAGLSSAVRVWLLREAQAGDRNPGRDT
jgi:predicted DNA-binding ribbon-helix-helix protein